MKTFLILSSFLSSACFGQTEIINTSLTDPRANVAYRFLDNMLLVQNHEQDSSIFLLSNNDTLRRFGSEYYSYLYQPREGKTDTISAIKDKQLLAQKIVTVENLKFPEVILSGIRDSLVTKSQLLENKGLFVSFEPQLVKSTHRVLSFTGEIITQSGRVIPFEQPSNQFQQSGLKLLKKLQKGDILIIRNVKTICPDCVARNRVVNLRFVLI